MLHRQMQPGEAAHGDADDVGFIDAESIQHRDGIVHGVLLRVRAGIGRHLRREVAPGRVGDAAMTSGEPPHLGLPAPVIAGVLVNEQDGVAMTGRLRV